jgi:hypothetical protein
MHCAKMLEDIQRKIAEVRAKLPNLRVLYATIAQPSVRNSRNKVDKLFRRLRPDLSTGPADTRQDAPKTRNMRENTRTRAPPHYNSNAHGYPTTPEALTEDATRSNTNTAKMF